MHMKRFSSELNPSFDGGLDLSEHAYRNGKTKSVINTNIPIATGSDIEPPTPVHYQSYLETVNGKEVEFIVSQPEQDSNGEVIIVHQGWLNAATSPQSRHQANLLHQTSPEGSTVIMINSPGVGKSDRLPNAASREIRESGSFAAYGEILKTALTGILSDFDHTKAIGLSTGGRAIIGIGVANDGLPFDHTISYDAPGSKDLGGLNGIAEVFLNREKKLDDVYGQANADPLTIELRKRSSPRGELYRTLASISMRGALNQQLIDFPTAMSKSGLAADLELATANLRPYQTLSLLTPELSMLNDHERVKQIAEEVSRNTHALLRHVTLYGHSHGFMDAHTPALVEVIRRNIPDNEMLRAA